MDIGFLKHNCGLENIKFERKSWKSLSPIGIGNGENYIFYPKDIEELCRILLFSKKEKIPIMAIGKCNSIIGSDVCDTHILIALSFGGDIEIKRYNANGIIVKVSADMSIANFAKYTATVGFRTMEIFKDVPGTIGGGIINEVSKNNIRLIDYFVSAEIVSIDGDQFKIRDLNSFDIINSGIITHIVFKLPNEEYKTSESISLLNENILQDNIPHKEIGYPFKDPDMETTFQYLANKYLNSSIFWKKNSYGLSINREYPNLIKLENNKVADVEIFRYLLSIKKELFRKSGILINRKISFADESLNEYFDNFPETFKVGVLKGGSSRERGISLESACNVSNAIKKAGYIVMDFDITKPRLPKEVVNSCDIVFPVLHGGFGEDGTIQRELEINNILYIGCDSKTSAITIDKVKTKRFFVENNIVTPKFFILSPEDRDVPKNIKLPVVVKPSREGSTFGISIVKKIEHLGEAIDKAFIDKSGSILIEEYIDGYELTVAVLYGTALPIVHIVYPGDLYDYDAKYLHIDGDTEYIVPPDPSIIPAALQREIKEMAEKIYHLLKARDLIRIDLIVRKSDLQLFFIEVNTIPGFTSSSLFPKAAKAAGITYIELCAKLIYHRLCIEGRYRDL